MNPNWSPGLKALYVFLCLAGTALAMWAIGVWIARPVGGWAAEMSTKAPPEVTFAIIFIGIPIAWFAFYKVGRRRGWI